MFGTFYGISVAASALRAQQQALDILGHNVANAGTPGYRRQRAILSQSSPLTGAFASGTTGLSSVGTGVRVEQIQSVQDSFIDTRVRLAAGQSALWDARNQTLRQVEALFNEPGEAGLEHELDQFWSAWEQLSTQPDSVPSRLALVEHSQRLSQSIRESCAHLERMRDDLDEAVAQKTERVNGITADIADLNAKIMLASSNNLTPNDLLDRRDLLVEELGALTGAEASGRGGQEFVVTLAGKVLVQGVNAFPLGVRLAADGSQEIFCLADGEARVVSGGEIAGLQSARDESAPRFRALLDELAMTLAGEVNAIHRTGVTADGAPAGDFFTPGTTAANLEVSAAILASPAAIATSATGASGDNSVALAIAALRSETVAGGQTINQQYRSLVSEVGTQTALAAHTAETQRLSLDQFRAQQQAISGVSLDEEMADMIRFQQAYNATARVLTSFDQMLSTLIERTGLVGR